MKFQWKGIKSGEFANGVIEAISQDEAIFILKRDDVIVTEIYGDDSLVVTPKKKVGLLSKSRKKVRIKDKELLQFTRKLAAMLSSGLPIVPSLEMLRDQSDGKGLKQVLVEIVEQVNSGVPISKCLEKYPESFDAVYLNLIKAGESSGSLEVFLLKICANLEKKIKIYSDLKSALTYPIILLLVAFGVILVMMTFVIPVFAEMYSSMGAALPLPTQLVLSISAFVRSPGALVLVAVIAGLSYWFKHALKTNAAFKLAFDQRILKVPVFGELIVHSSFARIAGILSNLVSAGVHLLEAIEIAKQSITNTYIQEGLENLKRQVYSGSAMEPVLIDDPRFPQTFSAFVAVGERTGKMNDMMTSIARFYEDEFDQSVDRLSQLLEPMMIVFLGLTIGFILVAMYMPIFSIGKAVGG